VRAAFSTRGRGFTHAVLLMAVGLSVVIAGLTGPAGQADAEAISAPAQVPAGVRQSSDVLPIPADVQLHLGETATLDGGELQVSLVQVEEDSRCPMNVMCVWMGRGLVRLRATVDGVDKGEVTASTNSGPDPDAVVDRYVLSLTDLQPYPQAGQPQPLDQRVATIHVKTGTP